MATISLNKNTLAEERRKLQLFERYLPSLELKQEQLTAEHKKATQILAKAEEGAHQASHSLDGLLPILGTTKMKLSGLVRVRRVELGEEDLLGVHLPTLGAVEFDTASYSFLATPFWFEALVTCLKDVATYRIRLEVYRERAKRLEAGVRRITQRVNLFEKVLIPNAKRNIARIEIFLSDVARAAVVTAKLAKRKRAEEAA